MKTYWFVHKWQRLFHSLFRKVFHAFTRNISRLLLLRRQWILCTCLCVYMCQWYLFTSVVCQQYSVPYLAYCWYSPMRPRSDKGDQVALLYALALCISSAWVSPLILAVDYRKSTIRKCPDYLNMFCRDLHMTEGLIQVLDQRNTSVTESFIDTGAQTRE